jgi:hypothetical protein
MWILKTLHTCLLPAYYYIKICILLQQFDRIILWRSYFPSFLKYFIKMFVHANLPTFYLGIHQDSACLFITIWTLAYHYRYIIPLSLKKCLPFLTFECFIKKGIGRRYLFLCQNHWYLNCNKKQQAKTKKSRIFLLNMLT